MLIANAQADLVHSTSATGIFVVRILQLITWCLKWMSAIFEAHIDCCVILSGF